MNGTRLTDEWQPSDKDVLAVTLKYRLTPGQVIWIRDRFVDYFTGPDATRPVKKDWGRAFRNWCDTDAAKARRTIKQEQGCAGESLDLWRLRMNGWLKGLAWPAFAGPKPNEEGNFIPRVIREEFGLLQKKEARPQVAARASVIDIDPKSPISLSD